MKRFMTILASILTFACVASADNERAVSFERLPDNARNFILTAFPGEKLAYARQERDFLEVHYEVVLVGGAKIEFDRRGNWTSIECRYSTLDPDLIPVPIRNYVDGAYAGAGYREISRDRREYEVKLTYGIELTFDRNFNLMDIDD